MHYHHHFAIEVASVQQCIKEHERMSVDENNVTGSEFLCKEIYPTAFHLENKRKEPIYYFIVKWSETVQIYTSTFDLSDCVCIQREIVEI